MRYTLEEREERARKTALMWQNPDYRARVTAKQKQLGYRQYPAKVG